MTAGATIEVIPLRLNASPASVAEAMTLLSADEIVRCNTLRSAMLQTTFALRRAALRILVAQHLEIAASAVRFAYGAHGKPSIAGASNVHVSASSAGELAVIACSTAGDIGIDVERMREVPELLDVAAETFEPDECAQLATLSEAERERVFYRYWTRKEALLKATGAGFTGGAPARTAGGWTVAELRLDDEYACALAYRGEPSIEIASLVKAGDFIARARQ